MINHSMNPYRYKQIQRKARARGMICMVGGLIVDEMGHVFFLKRSENLDLFPGCWDIPGGRVIEDESLFIALARYIQEETGWRLTDILAEVRTFEWRSANSKPGQSFLEFDFLVKVRGDLDIPDLNPNKFSSYHWIGPGDLDLFQENQNPESLDIYRLAEKALQMVDQSGPNVLHTSDVNSSLLEI